MTDEVDDPPSMHARRSNIPTAFLAFLIGGLGVLALHDVLGFGGASLDGFFEEDVYLALMFGATATVLARAATRAEQRATWLMMGIGLLFWSAGELYDTLAIEHTSLSPGGSVSLADVFYLASYPCYYVALTLLARTHLRELRIGMWLDGLIAGLGAATIAAALVLPPILHSVSASNGSVMIVSIAYPIGDLLMMMFALGAIGITGWRPGGVWLLIAAAMLANAVADSIYLYQIATVSYEPGTWLEFLWPLAAILMATAAWTPAAGVQRRRLKSWQMMLVPTLALISALGVLVYGNLGPQLTVPALVLAASTVLAVGAHLIVTLRQNMLLLAHSRHLSMTDPLTGLGNRRSLMKALQAACAAAVAGEPCDLVLYDLDGFKLYNDAFGHPAGDALLQRLSARLKRAVAPYGTAYRMGGDEFCVLFADCPSDNQARIRASVAALAEHGPGFSITASHGVVRIPSEMSDLSTIMQLADQRLYRRKEEVAAQRTVPVPTIEHASENGSAPSSADAYDGEHALPLGKGDDSALAGAMSEQSTSDRRVRRQPPL